MRKLFALLILGATFALTPSAFAMSVFDYEPVLHLSPRYHAGTLEKDVELSQGRVGTYIQLVGANAEQTAYLLAALAQKTAHGMKAMRAHVNCVETPMNCGNQGWKPAK